MKDLTYKSRVLKEFGERFVAPIFCDYSNHDDDAEMMKAFISQALDGQLAEIREKVAALKRKKPGEISIVYSEVLEEIQIYNGAIYDALTLIPNPSQHE